MQGLGSVRVMGLGFKVGTVGTQYLFRFWVEGFGFWVFVRTCPSLPLEGARLQT